MKNIELELLEKLDNYTPPKDLKLEEIKNLRNELKKAGNCNHIRTTSFNWEHDSGYGKQTYIKGRKCLACFKIKRWPLSQLWDDPDDRHEY